jgi:uncharacterized protein YndB with AHSA1/START domain
MPTIETSATVTIDAPADRVWAAITTPAQIKEWFFGVDTEAEWRPGGTLIHRGTYQGQLYEDKGEILEIDPPTTLVHTHWSPASGLPDQPEHYQRVTWSLREQGAITELMVSERDLPSEDAKAISDQSWPMVLGNLKRLLEA